MAAELSEKLQAQIERRKKQARGRMIHEKASDVWSHPGCCVIDHVLGFKIANTDGEYTDLWSKSYMDIDYEGQRVYEDISVTGGRSKVRVLKYIPGKWEEKLDLLSEDAQKERKAKELRKKKEQKEEKLEELCRTKANWGID